MSQKAYGGSKPAETLETGIRHGDLKPENILWFANGAANPAIGVLKIADFGLASVHSKRSRSNISPLGIGCSPTYRAPEFDMPRGLLSRSYDIWALGCIYLEFITWYFTGWDGVVKFSTLREYKRNNLSADDPYFEVSVSQIPEPCAAKSSLRYFV